MGSVWMIRRSGTDCKVSGLCGGLAAHWRIDPVVVRVVVALLALSGGVGLVLYAAGWLLIPVDGKDKALVDDLFGERAARIPREAWIAIVAVACVLFLGISGPVVPFGFGPAVIIATIWYFGFYRPRSRSQPRNRDRNNQGCSGQQPIAGAAARASQPPDGQHTDDLSHFFSGPPTPFTEAARAWQARVFAAHQGHSATYQGHATSVQQGPDRLVPNLPAPNQPAPKQPAAALQDIEEDQAAFFAHPDPVGIFTAPPPGPAATGGALTGPAAPGGALTGSAVTAGPTGSVSTASLSRRADSPAARRLRWISLLVLGLVLSGLGVADAIGAAVPVAAYFGAALLVVGLTLVLAAFFGRARGLLLAGFVLLLGLAITSAAATVGHPTRFANPQVISYASLTEMPSTYQGGVGRVEVDLRQVAVSKNQTFSAVLKAGLLEVWIPPEANVRIEYVLDAGSFDVLGQDGGGLDVQGTKEQLPSPGKPVLTLKLHANTGRVVVS